MERYKELMSAVKIVRDARQAVGAEDGFTNNPAYDMLMRAGFYLTDQAARAMRGEAL